MSTVGFNSEAAAQQKCCFGFPNSEKVYMLRLGSHDTTVIAADVLEVLLFSVVIHHHRHHHHHHYLIYLFILLKYTKTQQ